jgi:hypothetical protein
MGLFRADPAAGLKKAQTALAATEAKIAELEDQRRIALGESDAIEPVAVLDSELAVQRAAAATYRDRIIVLKSAVRASNEDERQKQYDAGLREVAKRLFSDKAWVKSYLDGGVRERQQMSLISIILSSRVAESPK